MEVEFIGVAETAQLVRRVLKQKFPGVKFSVRIHRAAWVSAIDVTWTDVPLEGEVEALMSRYASRRFDAMIDFPFQVTHYLLSDGETVIRHSPGTRSMGGTYDDIDNSHLLADMPDDVRIVEFGSDYINCFRKVSGSGAE